MNRFSEVDFLAAKLELFCAEISDEPSRANARLLFGTPIAAWKKDATPSRNRLVKLELTMEQMFAASISSDARAKIAKELMRSYGYASLGDSPIAIANQVLNRGKIATDTEAAVIRTFINDQGNETSVGARNFHKLAQIMTQYGD